MQSALLHRRYLCVALALIAGPSWASDGAMPSAAPALLFEQSPALAASIAPARPKPDEPARVDRFGARVPADSLATLRGGDGSIDNRNNVNGRVTDNVADGVVSGNNTLGDNAFSGASGISTVIQNTGSNVLIQNAMIVTVKFADPSP